MGAGQTKLLTKQIGQMRTRRDVLADAAAIDDQFHF
jgi:hypothetical protein